MNILLLNQYAPPDLSPTARLLGELTDNLNAAGHQTIVVAQETIYRGHHSRPGSRLRREFAALWKIFVIALRAQPKPDVILAFSSPPCLLAAAAAVSIIRKIPVSTWVMDVYPDLAIALGELQSGGIALFFRRLMRWAYHRCRIVVVLDRDMAERLGTRYHVATKILQPWPASALSTHTDKRSNDANEDSPGAQIAREHWTWLYSGNLGRAHEWQVLLDTQAALEKKDLPIHLLFEGGGAAWSEARDYANSLGLHQCHWTDYVDETQSAQTFHACRLIVATQRSEAQGLLWPSKLARVIPTSKPLLWIGPPHGAIASSLQSRARTVSLTSKDTDQIMTWITELFRSDYRPDPETDKKLLEKSCKTQIKVGCEMWEKWLGEAAGTSV